MVINKKNVRKSFLGLLSGSMLLMGGCSSTAKKSPLDPKNPTVITVWNYYNGDQLAAFDQLVSDFNASVGVEQGITVVSESKSAIDNVANEVIASAEGKVGASDLPDLAAVYSETAVLLADKDLLANLDDYVTKDEQSKYVPGFIEEGRMVENGPLYLFPVMKSTECFSVNKTDWAPFEAATGITIDSIKTYEDLTSAAEKYYEYTDGLTPDVANDGKSLYGRDSIANYVYLGCKQLGHTPYEIDAEGKVTVTLDKETFKTLWDNYYIPFVKGYFSETAKFRSEDMKTGSILAVTTSTSGVSYLPTAVTDADDTQHDIELTLSKQMSFKNGEAISIQQGAGYCVFKSDDARQYASVEFLKWLTDSQRNLEFAVASGYSPVTIEANNPQTIEEKFKSENDTTSTKQQNVLNALLISADVYVNDVTYTYKPFAESKDLRTAVGDTFQKTCVDDRAKVVEKLTAGSSLEDATKEFTSDAYFDAWFAEFEKTVNSIVK